MSDFSPPPPPPAARNTAPPGYVAYGAQPAPAQPVRGLGKAVVILQGVGIAESVVVRQLTDRHARLTGEA